MPHYLLSIYQPAGDPPPPEQLDPVMKKVFSLVEEAKAQNVWVFNGGLHAPSTGSVVQIKTGEAVITDGPYTEGKEHIGGFMVIQVPDLDAALRWAGKLADALTIAGFPQSLPIEVRPFSHVGTGG